MSRSKPTERTPNPATRWFEWDGEHGTVRYYDKKEKTNVDMGHDFTFILLDELYTVKGWHEETESGIYSNEIRDTRDEQLIVKAFKAKQPIAEGFYKQIKDRVKASGGKFVANLYICYKEGKELKLASLQMKGAALNAWVDFRKDNRDAVYEKAVRIKGSKDGKKGSIKFKTPVLHLADISAETNSQAKAIDETLQKFLDGYFKRTRLEQTEAETHPEEENQDREPSPASRRPDDDEPPAEEDDIPF